MTERRAPPRIRTSELRDRRPRSPPRDEFSNVRNVSPRPRAGRRAAADRSWRLMAMHKGDCEINIRTVRCIQQITTMRKCNVPSHRHRRRHPGSAPTQLYSTLAGSPYSALPIQLNLPTQLNLLSYNPHTRTARVRSRRLQLVALRVPLCGCWCSGIARLDAIGERVPLDAAAKGRLGSAVRTTANC